MKAYLISPLKVILVGGLVVTSLVHGQLRTEVPRIAGGQSLQSAASSPWLDAQRFSMSHGFSLAFMSAGGLGAGPASLGVYTNQMRYLINENIVLNSQIHLVQPGVSSALEIGAQNIKMYYQTALDWKLTKNINMRVAISNLPSRRYGYGYGYGLGQSMFAPYYGTQGWDASFR